MAKNKVYTIEWQRLHGDDESQQRNRIRGKMNSCKGLTPRTALARLTKALRNSGPVIIHSIEQEPTT